MEKLSIPNEYLGNYRKEVLSVDDASMLCALLQSKMSHDPSTQVGACLVDERGVILSTGYNRPTLSWNINSFPWERNVSEIGEENTKYPYICHAELNCLCGINVSRDVLSRSTLYVTLFPCKECAKVIIQSGIKRIVYLDDFYAHLLETRCSKLLLEKSGIECISFRDITSIEDCSIEFGEKAVVNTRKRE